MAIARPSPLVGGISGRIGGCVFRNTRAGLVVASPARPRATISSTQETVRAAIAQYQQDWRDCAYIDRQSFYAGSRTITWPNRLGVPRHPSPLNLFVCMNMMFNPEPHRPYTPTILACSGNQTIPPIEFSVACSLSTGLIVTADNPTFFLGLLWQVGFIARGLAPGQTYAPKFWRRLGKVNTAYPTHNWSLLAAASGGPAQLGERIAFKLIWVYHYSMYSAPKTAFCTVTP